MELGLQPATVFQRAGLPMALFNQEKILVTTEEFFALYRGIAESSSDPAIGIKLGTEERVERYDRSRSLRSPVVRFATR